jgi:CspA family cold shock protein
MKGTVKWWNDSKGYGFIACEGHPEGIFAHYTAIQTEGFKTLAEDQAVQFDLLDGPKGPQAMNIRKACDL